MVKKPKWTELVPSRLAERDKPIHGIVLHDTAGCGIRQLSDINSDFVVERDGSIWNFNPKLKKYYMDHASDHTRFIMGLRDADVSKATVGIQIVQTPYMMLTPVYTDLQIRAVSRLVAWLLDKFKLGTEAVISHKALSIDRSRLDPREFNWQLMWKYVDEARNGD